MTSRRRIPARSSVARRGVLLGGPALLLAGCGLLPSGDSDETPEGGSDAAEATEAADDADSTTPPPGTTATVEFDVVEVVDEVTAGNLMSRVEDSATMVHPYVEASVVATTLLESLTAEQYTALTGDKVPPADGVEDEEQPATTVLPGELKRFLLTAWESADPGWKPKPSRHLSTDLHITHDGNEAIYLDRAKDGHARHSGIVLAIVDADPAPDAVALRAEIQDGVQELSLVDGTVITTPAPRLYSQRGLDVEVSDAGVIDIDVPDGFGDDYMALHGTVEEAYLSAFIDGELDVGGGLGWAGEEEIFLVVPLAWDRDHSSNVKDLSEVVLVLPDGEELRPAQDQSWIFTSSYPQPIATFTVSAALESATVKIMPRFGQVLDEDFEQVEDPITATLTIA